MRTMHWMIVGLLAASLGCGGDEGGPSLRIDVFGYGPDFQGGTGFVSGLPGFEGQETVNVSLVQPLDRRTLKRGSFVASSQTGKVPELSFGQNLRLDLEVLNGAGEVIASGSTPRFDYTPEEGDKTFRIQVLGADSVSPVGSVVLDSSTQERRFTQSRFDYRAMPESSCTSDDQCGPSATCSGTPQTCKTWLGRAGHAMAQLSDGRVIVAGGGDPTPGAATLTLPKYRTMTVDLQIFDPATGYFTEAGFDSAGNDRFDQPFVHGTMTAIGDDKFVVAGGFTKQEDGVMATDGLYLVDMNQPEGSRISAIRGSDGQPSRLKVARGWHAAAYRPSDNAVLFIGGLGVLGEDDVLPTFEILEVSTGDILGPFNLDEARAEATALTMGDGTSIWVLGGRNAEGAMASTEVIAGTESSPEADMREARFGHSAIRISTSPNASLAMVIGGYTDFEGAATGGFEIGGIGRGAFQGGNDWTLSDARGRLMAVELPVSRDIVVLGGKNAGQNVDSVERLEFTDLTQALPYQARAAGVLDEHRYQGTALVLSSGKVLLVGGVGSIQGSIAARDSASFYNAHDPVPAPAN